MLAFFRAISRSRIGAAIGVAFLVVIMLGFAGGDLSNLRLGSLVGGEDAANVGNDKVTTGELEKTLRSAYESQRQREQTLTMKAFIGEGALDEVLTGLIDRAAIWAWGERHGFVVSDRLIDSEIAKLPAFQGPDGKFSQSAYNQLLAQRGLTDALVRADIGKGLMQHLVFAGASEGSTMPVGVTQAYAGLLKEARSGTIVTLPAAAFAPKAAPGDAEIAAYYKANIATYQRPERRTIRYALIDDSSLKNVPAPSEAEIARRYQANSATYAAAELRSVTQVVLPTEAAARAFAAEVGSGKSIEAAAGAKGLAAAKLVDRSRDQISGDSGKAVGDAVFGAATGKLVGPVKGTLGWVIAHVDGVKRKEGKTLDQARAELTTALTLEKRKLALTDLATRVGEKLEGGTSLGDVARTYGLSVITTEPLLADGTIPGKPGDKVADTIKPLLQAAFAMEREGQPQIAAVPTTGQVVAYDVGQITPASPAPLAEIRAAVAADWTRAKGAAAAGAAADRILAALAKNTPADAAIKALGVTLPPVDHIRFTREQVAQMQPRPPAPLSLLFTLTQGTARKLAANANAGWLVVRLDSVEPANVAANDPAVAQAAGELAKAVGNEYAAELRSAISKEVGSRRNPAAIAKVRENLTGTP